VGRIERDLDVERRDALRRAERIRAVNQGPWAIGTAFYDQRDTYTKSAAIDATGYGRGPSFHPAEGSYAYPRHTQPNEQEVRASDASLYEKEAWPWLVYKETSADPYFAHLHEREPRSRRAWRRLRAVVARLLGRRTDTERRSDARIRADAVDALWLRRDLDTSDIEVRVRSGEVTLEGTVADRHDKHVAAEVIRGLRGVRAVRNHLEVRHDDTSDVGIAFVPAT
jgi:hypothetical protein